METKEIKIGSWNFLINKTRSFKDQCDLEMEMHPDNTRVPRYKIIQADCRVMDLIRNKKGDIIKKDYRKITEEDIFQITDEEGDELYLEVLKFRFPGQLDDVKKKIQMDMETSKKSNSLSEMQLQDGINGQPLNG